MPRIGGGNIGGTSSGGGTTQTVTRAGEPLSAVGGWTNMAAVTGAFNAAGASFRIPFRVPFACTNLRLTFATWLYDEGTMREKFLGNTLPIKAAIEYGAATFPLFFNGLRQPTLDSGAQMQTDPFGLTLPAGAEGWIRVFANGGAGQVLQGGIGGGPGVTATSSWVNGSDVCDATGAMTSTPIQYGAPAPYAVTAVPLTDTPPATVLCIGDSIPTGYNDTSIAQWASSSPNSWFTRWINSTVGAGRLAGKSDQLSFWATPGIAGRRLAMVRGFSHALIQLGSNDVYQNRTLVQMQADYTSLVGTVRALGCKVIGATILPRNNSTDAWATTAGQTTQTWEPVRVAFNNWLRTKPVGIVSVLEAADTVETARNSGLWKVNGAANYLTADGTHPTPAGHQMVAAGLPAPGAVLV